MAWSKGKVNLPHPNGWLHTKLGGVKTALENALPLARHNFRPSSPVKIPAAPYLGTSTIRKANLELSKATVYETYRRLQFR